MPKISFDNEKVALHTFIRLFFSANIIVNYLILNQNRNQLIKPYN